MRITCPAGSIEHVLRAHFAGLAASSASGMPALDYDVSRGPDGCSLAAANHPAIPIENPADLLFHLDKWMTVDLQRQRPDLLFLHAAAIERDGRAWLLAGDSGHGKSTTCWGLLHHGFRYLSDELSPIDVGSLQVHPYPRALCLKRQPPPDYPLPSQTLDLGGTLHVPVPALPGGCASTACRIEALLFVRHRPDLAAPALRPISAAQAGARMYVTALNALAHSRRGLDAVADIAERVPCFTLDAADLRSTCALVRASISPIGLGADAS